MIKSRDMVDLMNPEDIELPPPEALDDAADMMPIKVPLKDYRSAMQKLRDKNYSYQEIAKWMSDSLGVKVSRNQVAYVLTTDPMVQDLEEADEAAEDEAEERSQ